MERSFINISRYAKAIKIHQDFPESWSQMYCDSVVWSSAESSHPDVCDSVDVCSHIALPWAWLDMCIHYGRVWWYVVISLVNWCDADWWCADCTYFSLCCLLWLLTEYLSSSPHFLLATLASFDWLYKETKIQIKCRQCQSFCYFIVFLTWLLSCD